MIRLKKFIWKMRYAVAYKQLTGLDWELCKANARRELDSLGKYWNQYDPEFIGHVDAADFNLNDRQLGDAQ